MLFYRRRMHRINNIHSIVSVPEELPIFEGFTSVYEIFWNKRYPRN